MHARTLLGFGLIVGALGVLPTVFAAGTAQAAGASPAHPLLTEIPDPQLAVLRGRFIVGNNTVAYFGVSMLSSWTSPSGQQLQGGATLGMHFAANTQLPSITFTPTMTIVQGVPIAVPAAGITRSVDGSGLANVNGLLQGIQVAGDGNRALNVAAVRVTDSGTEPTGSVPGGNSQAVDSRLTSGNASVAIAFDPARGVSLDLGIAGQGLVSQWIRAGSVGQLVQLTSDGQSVANVLQLDLVMNPGSAGNQALHDAAQALLQARAAGTNGWQ